MAEAAAAISPGDARQLLLPDPLVLAGERSRQRGGTLHSARTHSDVCRPAGGARRAQPAGPGPVWPAAPRAAGRCRERSGRPASAPGPQGEGPASDRPTRAGARSQLRWGAMDAPPANGCERSERAAALTSGMPGKWPPRTGPNTQGVQYGINPA